MTFLVYGIAAVFAAFQKLAPEMEKLLEKVERNEKLPELKVLIDVKVPSIWGAFKLFFRVLFRRVVTPLPYIT